MSLFTFFKSIKKPDKYSYEWIHSLSPAQWAKERELVRTKLPTAPFNTPEWIRQAVNRDNLLALFDKVKHDQFEAAHPGQVFTPRAPREGGWWINHRN